MQQDSLKPVYLRYEILEVGLKEPEASLRPVSGPVPGSVSGPAPGPVSGPAPGPVSELVYLA